MNMNYYSITLQFSGFKALADIPPERLQQLMQSQCFLPLALFPDQAREQEPLRIEYHPAEVMLSCTVRAPRRSEAHLRLSALADELRAVLRTELDQPELEVGAYVSLDSLVMTLDLILKGPHGYFAVYRAGAIYALGDEIPPQGLLDPLSYLFQAGGLHKLGRLESWQLLNDSTYQTVWFHGASLISQPSQHPEPGLMSQELMPKLHLRSRTNKKKVA